MVKELRERTGAAMMDCKKALTATEGDMDAAIEKMRVEGMAKADKKASRVASEGVIAVAEGNGKIAILEVNCETDFVGKNDDFLAFADAAANAVLTDNPADVAELSAIKVGSETLEERRRALTSKLGENLGLRRFAVIESAGGGMAQYRHGARIGVAVSMVKGDDDLAKDIALHVAASNPMFVTSSEVTEDVLDAERRIFSAQAAESGKPAEIIEKMVEGRMRKYLAEITLVGQPFVKDPDITVEKLLKSKSAEVARFVRFEVGEGIEKQESDFAAEVAATAKATMA